MKKLFLLNLALCFMALPLYAQNVWSSKIDTFANYVRQPGNAPNPNANGIVSVFTPATSITINRIQLQAAGAGKNCSLLPGIKVTDGTSSIVLRIPNSKEDSGDFGPISNDTGVISKSFPAGDQITLRVVPGAARTCSAPYEINIVVQYSVP